MTSEKIWLVSVGAGWQQISGIKKAKNLGISVLAIDANGNAPGLKFADYYLVEDIFNFKKIINAIKNLGIIPNGVLSFISDAGMMCSAKIREEFDLIGPRTKTTQVLLNKNLQRKILQAEYPNLNPKWLLCNDENEAIKSLNEFESHIIIKPSDSAGSRAVSKTTISNKSNLKFIREAFKTSRSNTILIEEFIEGKELSVETFTKNNETKVIAISERILKGRVTANQIISYVPNNNQKDLIICTVSKVLKSFGYINGPAHIEMFIDKKGEIKIVEVAGRGGGFKIFDTLVPLVSGYDTMEASILQALGKNFQFPLQIRTKNFVVITYIQSSNGIVKSIEGFDNINYCDGIIAESFKKIGEKTKSSTNDADRLGYILSYDKNKEIAYKKNSVALKKINYQIL